MALIAAGLSHRTAPVAIRERVAIAPHEAGAFLAHVLEETGAREAAVLSTCNRTEIYLMEGERDGAAAVWRALSARLGSDVTAYGYVWRDRDAVRHLYRVAAGMDSMILGEMQIHGQVRDAWELCRQASGPALNRLFQSGLLVASRVHHETALGRGAASVSSAAVQLAKKIFGSLQGRRAMVLGAGEMADVALECLVHEGVRAVIVANRTYERAAELAARHGAQALHYEQCWGRLAEVDLLLCSTAAPRPIVAREQVEPALRVRGDAPLCIVDIAVPRDVMVDVGTLHNVFLYDLDDLQAVVSTNLARRREELPAAEVIVATEVEQYWHWLAGLAAVPVLKLFRSQMEQVREAELAHAMRKLGHLAPDDQHAVEHFSRALMNKFLHDPSVRLRAASANGRGLAIVDALRYLFALDEADGPGDVPPAVAPESEER